MVFSQIKHWITYLQPITKKTGNHGIPFGRSEGISMRPARPDRRKGEMAMIIVSTIVSAITAKIVGGYYFKKVDGYVKEMCEMTIKSNENTLVTLRRLQKNSSQEE